MRSCVKNHAVSFYGVIAFVLFMASYLYAYSYRQIDPALSKDAADCVQMSAFGLFISLFCIVASVVELKELTVGKGVLFIMLGIAFSMILKGLFGSSEHPLQGYFQWQFIKSDATASYTQFSITSIQSFLYALQDAAVLACAGAGGGLIGSAALVTATDNVPSPTTNASNDCYYRITKLEHSLKELKKGLRMLSLLQGATFILVVIVLIVKS